MPISLSLLHLQADHSSEDADRRLALALQAHEWRASLPHPRPHHRHAARSGSRPGPDSGQGTARHHQPFRIAPSRVPHHSSPVYPPDVAHGADEDERLWFSPQMREYLAGGAVRGVRREGGSGRDGGDGDGLGARRRGRSRLDLLRRQRRGRAGRGGAIDLDTHDGGDNDPFDGFGGDGRSGSEGGTDEEERDEDEEAGALGGRFGDGGVGGVDVNSDELLVLHDSDDDAGTGGEEDGFLGEGEREGEVGLLRSSFSERQFARMEARMRASLGLRRPQPYDRRDASYDSRGPATARAAGRSGGAGSAGGLAMEREGGLGINAWREGLIARGMRREGAGEGVPGARVVGGRSPAVGTSADADMAAAAAATGGGGAGGVLQGGRLGHGAGAGVQQRGGEARAGGVAEEGGEIGGEIADERGVVQPGAGDQDEGDGVEAGATITNAEALAAVQAGSSRRMMAGRRGGRSRERGGAPEHQSLLTSGEFWNPAMVWMQWQGTLRGMNGEGSNGEIRMVLSVMCKEGVMRWEKKRLMKIVTLC